MNFQGFYTIKNGDKNIVAKNHITEDGFQLVQNWLASYDNSEFKKIDLFNQEQEINITSNSISTTTLSSVLDVFKGYTGNFDTTTATNAYFTITFNSIKKIKAIGIDTVVVQSFSTCPNANIEVYYQENEYSNYKKLEQLSIPISCKQNADDDDRSKGQKNYIYSLNKYVDAYSIKIKFNSFSNDLLKYRIYSIYIYQQQQQCLSPNYITIYDQNKNILKTKMVDLKIKNTANRSVIFKTTLQFQELDQSDCVKYISLDFLDIQTKNLKQFSFAQFEQAWSQQSMQIIQIQYQLLLTNNYENSSNSSFSSSSLI